MMISKDDFIQWLDHPVTKDFQETVLKELDGHIANLANNAGLDPLRDRFICGAIACARFMADWVPEFRDEGQPEEEEVDDA